MSYQNFLDSERICSQHFPFESIIMAAMRLKEDEAKSWELTKKYPLIFADLTKQVGKDSSEKYQRTAICGYNRWGGGAMPPPPKLKER